jgi:hypothetical protein
MTNSVQPQLNGTAGVKIIKSNVRINCTRYYVSGNTNLINLPVISKCLFECAFKSMRFPFVINWRNMKQIEITLTQFFLVGSWVSFWSPNIDSLHCNRLPNFVLSEKSALVVRQPPNVANNFYVHRYFTCFPMLKFKLFSAWLLDHLFGLRIKLWCRQIQWMETEPS